jgi:hypothetical protein
MLSLTERSGKVYVAMNPLGALHQTHQATVFALPLALIAVGAKARRYYENGRSSSKKKQREQRTKAW